MVLGRECEQKSGGKILNKNTSEDTEKQPQGIFRNIFGDCSGELARL